MKLEVDENLPVEIAVSSSEAGHDALTVLDQGLGGHADGHVAKVCKRERRAPVTLDTDFANLQGSLPQLKGDPSKSPAASGVTGTTPTTPRCPSPLRGGVCRAVDAREQTPPVFTALTCGEGGIRTRGSVSPTPA